VIEAMVVLSLFVMSVGCNGFFVDPTVTSLVVSPATATVGISKTIQMTAFGTYSDGTRKQVSSGLNWTSSTTGVASIGLTSGVATGASAGSTTITGEAQGITGTATLTVVPSGITSIKVNPSTASIKQGASQQFMCLDQNGVDRSTLCTWSSNDTTDVTIDSTGVAQSVSTLTAPVLVTITATLQTDVATLTSTAKLTVSLP
jgi:hypothetical protein